MYRFCQLPPRFAPDRLQADLALACASGWLPHFVRSNYAGDWSGIPLRSVGGRPDHIFSDPCVSATGYAPTPILEGCAYLREVLAAFACPITSARLLKLGPGSEIREHRDHDLTYGSGVVRLHIPVTTHPLVEFYVEGERVVMGEGECWYIDATLPHRLVNRGDADRVHLVFDCELNPWLEEQFRQAGYQPRIPDFFEARGVRRADLDPIIAALRAQGSVAALRHAEELEAARRQGL